MDWKNFFKLTVYKQATNETRPYFESRLIVPEEFEMNKLIMGRFEDLNITHEEKKKLSLNLRKILLCHEQFNSTEFRKISNEFISKISKEKSSHLQFATSGGGIYLFLALMHKGPSAKKIVCHTSEIPLPIFKLPKYSHKLQFIYRPEDQSYLSNFPSLWQESELMSLFEIKGHKSKVA